MKTKRSKHWLKEHISDHYVNRARQEGYRSRAVYKLEELDKKHGLFKSGMSVIELGAAPGGWSQYLVDRVMPSGRVIASDLLPMEPISGVTFVPGDFSDPNVLQLILAALDQQRADLVISDMAPNISGVNVADQYRALHLVELASDLACQVLKAEGTFLCKFFQGEGLDDFVVQLRKYFRQVSIKKPRASRSKSREVYILAKQFKGCPIISESI